MLCPFRLTGYSTSQGSAGAAPASVRCTATPVRRGAAGRRQETSEQVVMQADVVTSSAAMHSSARRQCGMVSRQRRRATFWLRFPVGSIHADTTCPAVVIGAAPGRGSRAPRSPRSAYVLHQPAVPDFRKAPLALHHAEDVLATPPLRSLCTPPSPVCGVSAPDAVAS